MTALIEVAASTLRRSVRDRTFVLLGLVAPFLIMAALSATVGSALAGEYRPSLVIVDGTNGLVGDDLVAGLSMSGFDSVTLDATEADARLKVENGDVDAAIVLPGALVTPASLDAVSVIVNEDNQVAAEIATSIAEQVTNDITLTRLLLEVGAPLDNLTGPVTIRSGDDVGSTVLADGTYFAVGMSSFFAFFSSTVFLATYHQERKQSTLARMLLAPIGRLTPIVGKAIGVGLLMLVSYATLVVASTYLLGADWGPILGVVVTGLALVFTAVSVGTAVVTLTTSEEAASQAGIVLATGWAIFGGVFVEIPTSGPLAAGARLSPFTWALDTIGYNAGTGSLVDVLVRAAAIAAFGAVAVVIVILGRQRLVTP